MNASARTAIITAIVVVVAAAIFIATKPKRVPQLNTNAQQPSWLCPDRTLAENVAAADLILTGEVAAVLFQKTLADVWIKPRERFKGTPPSTGLRIMANPVEDAQGTVEGMGDLHFTSDDPPYLLFLKQRADGRFSTSACYGSRLLGDGLTPEEKTVLNVSG